MGKIGGLIVELLFLVDVNIYIYEKLLHPEKGMDMLDVTLIRGMGFK